MVGKILKWFNILGADSMVSKQIASAIWGESGSKGLLVGAGYMERLTKTTPQLGKCRGLEDRDCDNNRMVDKDIWFMNAL